MSGEFLGKKIPDEVAAVKRGWRPKNMKEQRNARQNRQDQVLADKATETKRVERPDEYRTVMGFSTDGTLFFVELVKVLRAPDEEIIDDSPQHSAMDDTPVDYGGHVL
jgi:hypothetical protein